MNKIFFIILLFPLCISCKKKELLITEGNNSSPLFHTFKFVIYEDSTYSYKYFEERTDPNNKYISSYDSLVEERGKIVIHKDSIYLINDNKKGLLKNGYVEFIGDNGTYERLKILNTHLYVNNTFNTKKHPKIHQISAYKYDYIIFDEEIQFQNIDLNDNEIIILEKLIKREFEHNPSLKKLNFDDYYLQIYPILNSSDEKIIYCNLACTEYSVLNNFMLVDDGGPCYMNFKINLNLKKLYEININGN